MPMPSNIDPQFQKVCDCFFGIILKHYDNISSVIKKIYAERALRDAMRIKYKKFYR